MFAETGLLERVFGLAYDVPSYWPPDEAAPYGHRKIIEAMAQRDADLTEKLVRQQIDAGKRRRLGLSNPGRNSGCAQRAATP